MSAIVEQEKDVGEEEGLQAELLRLRKDCSLAGQDLQAHESAVSNVGQRLQSLKDGDTDYLAFRRQ